MLAHISDPDDTRVHDYLNLTDTALRVRTEERAGLFIAESELVIRRALAAGYPMRSMLLEERWLSRMSDVVARAVAAGTPVYLADKAVLEALTGFNVHRGALASMQRRPLPSPAAVLVGARTDVVLEDIVNPTNVGGVFRAAAALGMDGVLLSPRCADPLYRRSVRVSMGTVLRLPYARLTQWYDAPAQLAAQGFTVAALTPAADALDVDSFARRRPQRLAVLVGSEGPGLSHRWMDQADVRLTIPMASGVDSLNVATAAAVAFHVLRSAASHMGSAAAATIDRAAVPNEDPAAAADED